MKMIPKLCGEESCGKPLKSRGLCSMHYERWRKYKDVNATYRYLPTDIAERLKFIGWNVTDTGCWEHLSSNSHGYRVMRINGHNQYAHRLAYEAWVGSIPNGYVVRHTCDNPPCMNPEHLLLGTQIDNVQDARDRRRYPVGEKHHNAKLSNEDIANIRILLSTGIKQSTVATLYGVSSSWISMINSGSRR